MPAQQRDKGGVEKARVADLDRVPQLPPAFGARPGTTGEPVIVAAGECGGRLGVARQDREEMVETLGVKSESGRELPQKRAELLFEPQYAGGEEIGERRLYIIQLFEVRDEAAALDGEDKAFRGLVVPSGEGFGTLQRIMGAVDLDRVDLPAREGQLIGMPQAARIKGAAPAAIVPAGDADADGPGTAQRRTPRRCAQRCQC